MPNWLKIEQFISAAISQPFKLNTHSVVSGGDINQALRLDGLLLENNEAISFFIKLNRKELLPMFEAEASGLQEIAKSKTIRVPHVISIGHESDHSFIILESLAFTATGSHQLLAQQLAAMHKKSAETFGWSQQNTIGSTPQINMQSDKWIEFWREQRLGYQLNLAKQNGANVSLIVKGETLIKELDSFFVDYKPKASLLHGDLWSGNYGFVEAGEPVIFDPAIYYGDREADIAMTELFGGFSTEFYNEYNTLWPLDKGYQQRKKLYNLYHVLNHFNMFGGGYALQSENMIDSLLNELG